MPNLEMVSSLGGFCCCEVVGLVQMHPAPPGRCLSHVRTVVMCLCMSLCESHACREAGEPGKARNYFPQDKQYLVTRGGELQPVLLASPWVLASPVQLLSCPPSLTFKCPCAAVGSPPNPLCALSSVCCAQCPA